MHYLVGCVDCSGSEFVDYRMTDVSVVVVVAVGGATVDMHRCPVNNFLLELHEVV